MTFRETSAPRVTRHLPGAPIRVLVYHDMEGLAGQDDWHTFLFSHPEKYPEGQKMLAADLNAVIEGLFAGGATQVDVVDAHGSGNPEPDVRRELLDPRAKQVFRDKPFDPYVDITEPNTYDAVVAVAMHAKTGSRGFASHTITLGMDMQINGNRSPSEIVGYSWGASACRSFLCPGDDHLQKDLEVMPRSSTSSRKGDERFDRRAHRRPGARRDAREGGACRAEHRQGEDYDLSTPMQAGLHAAPPASLAFLRASRDQLCQRDGDLHRARLPRRVRRRDRPRRRCQLVYPRMLQEVVRQQPDGQKLMADYSDALFVRWMDFESGRWQPPATPPRARKAYFGDR
jgi:D-amino peptidase